MQLCLLAPCGLASLPRPPGQVGHPLAKYASLLMAGQTLPELGFTEEPKVRAGHAGHAVPCRAALCCAAAPRGLSALQPPAALACCRGGGTSGS